MKKLLALAMSLLILCFALSGCGKDTAGKSDTASTGSAADPTGDSSTVATASTGSDSGKTDTPATSERVLYKKGLDSYVKLGNYKGVVIDTTSDTFRENLDSLAQSDAKEKSLLTKKEKGKVALGDTANIDYVGKKDGVAFDGGTAQGYDLEIGSGSFIPGFEDGLVGKEIGSTVDLNLTFPEQYHSEELAGQAVVFTVKINYVSAPMTPEESFKEMGFETADAYKADLTKRTAQDLLMETVSADANISSYPEEDIATILEAYKSMLEQNLQNSYGVGLSEYLASVGQTEKEFETSLTEEQIKPLMATQMVEYAIFDKENLSAGSGNGDWQAESQNISEATKEFLYQNATIK